MSTHEKRMKDLMKEAQKICDVMKLAAPGAVRSSKELIRAVQYKPITQELKDFTQGELIRVSCTEESKAGMVAIQNKQKPPWSTQDMTVPKLA